MRLTVGDRDHLAKNFAVGLNNKSYDILKSLGFRDIGDLVDYIEKRNETT